MRPETETPEEKEARIRRNADRSWNKFVHDSCLQISKAITLVASRNIDVAFVNWTGIQDTLKEIERAADNLGGRDD